MIENLPKKYKKNFLKKILNFFAEKFWKKESVHKYSENEGEINFKANYDISIELKKNTKNEEIKTRIIEIIEEKPEILETLQESRLQIISDIYDEKIQKIKNEINILKKEII